jgi:hypothetical protein
MATRQNWPWAWTTLEPAPTVLRPQENLATANSNLPSLTGWNGPSARMVTGRLPAESVPPDAEPDPVWVDPVCPRWSWSGLSMASMASTTTSAATARVRPRALPGGRGGGGSPQPGGPEPWSGGPPGPWGSRPWDLGAVVGTVAGEPGGLVPTALPGAGTWRPAGAVAGASWAQVRCSTWVTAAWVLPRSAVTPSPSSSISRPRALGRRAGSLAMARSTSRRGVGSSPSRSGASCTIR